MKAFVTLWGSCRGGMGGMQHWPDAGGVSDQAAWIVDAFGVLSSMSARLDEADRKARA